MVILPYGIEKHLVTIPCGNWKNWIFQFFQSPTLWWLKICSHQCYIDWKKFSHHKRGHQIWWFVGWWSNFFNCHLIHPHMIEWQPKFFNHQKGCEPMLSFWKNKKNSAFTFFLGWPENFDLHQMVWMCRISTKDFQSPSNGVGCWMATKII